ncbi:MAG: MaoC family dehydratase [Betaproteobacteria bacterium]|jgi:acyl dehydratase|nr:MaoC family dehydratase [Rhodocyclales bacterium]
MSTTFDSVASVLAAVGKPLGESDWVSVDQPRIDRFAAATDDHQWIHVDPVKAKDGPFGACIAHGYLTLALANRFLPDIVRYEKLRMGVNYGCDKVRFPAPVPVGSRLRGRGELIKAEAIEGGVQATIRITVDIEGKDRPACVVDTISRFFFND